MEVSAKDQDEWHGKIDGGVARFMRKWHEREAEASAKRHIDREAEAGRAVAAGTKRKRSGEARGRGKKLNRQA